MEDDLDGHDSYVAIDVDIKLWLMFGAQEVYQIVSNVFKLTNCQGYIQEVKLYKHMKYGTFKDFKKYCVLLLIDSNCGK